MAQAAVLIRALSDVRDKMISQITWLEKHDAQLDAAVYFVGWRAGSSTTPHRDMAAGNRIALIRV
jgi:hypothetical protein